MEDRAHYLPVRTVLYVLTTVEHWHVSGAAAGGGCWRRAAGVAPCDRHSPGGQPDDLLPRRRRRKGALPARPFLTPAEGVSPCCRCCAPVTSQKGGKCHNHKQRSAPLLSWPTGQPAAERGADGRRRHRTIGAAAAKRAHGGVQHRAPLAAAHGQTALKDHDVGRLAVGAAVVSSWLQCGLTCSLLSLCSAGRCLLLTPLATGLWRSSRSRAKLLGCGAQGHGADERAAGAQAHRGPPQRHHRHH